LHGEVDAWYLTLPATLSLECGHFRTWSRTLEDATD
jgi:hypothetical protein